MTNRQKYILSNDDDGHWYYFPVEKAPDFESWLSIQYGEDYDNPLYGNYPDWLKEVDGHPSWLTFENPEPR
jgi:hypothetical protein